MKSAIAHANIKEQPLKRSLTDDSLRTPLQQRGICPHRAMRFMNLQCALKSRQAIVVRLWRSTLRQQKSQIDKSEIAACDRLEVHHPDAQIWIVRIGSRVRRSGSFDVQNIITIPAKSATSC